MIKVAIDAKNLAKYSGGIAEYIKPLLIAWIGSHPEIEFVLIAPEFDSKDFIELPNCCIFHVGWPDYLPRFARHPIYDNVLFPNAIRKISPHLLFTPYHDVRIPKGIPSVMMIHDTCIGSLGDVYPLKIRKYYEFMLRLNLSRCIHVITVSESSRSDIVKRYRLQKDFVSVVPNCLSSSFASYAFDGEDHIKKIRNQQHGEMRLFYTGGSEYRKNIHRLILSLEVLEAEGVDVQLYSTGCADEGWVRASAGVKKSVMRRVNFLGYLSHNDLRNHYLATDVVVYPSLCEGFGRVCLEAMELGVALACSDIPVFREVAGDYPEFFNPLSISELVSAINLAWKKKIRPPKIDPRFQRDVVVNEFIHTMDFQLNKALQI